MNCSEKFKYVRNFSALSLVLNAFFSLPVHADDALLRACSNAKTAKELGLTVSPSTLIAADEVIE